MWFIEEFLGHEKRKTSLLTWSDVDLTPSVCPLIDHREQPMKMHTEVTLLFNTPIKLRPSLSNCMLYQCLFCTVTSEMSGAMGVSVGSKRHLGWLYTLTSSIVTWMRSFHRNNNIMPWQILSYSISHIFLSSPTRHFKTHCSHFSTRFSNDLLTNCISVLLIIISIFNAVFALPVPIYFQIR